MKELIDELLSAANLTQILVLVLAAVAGVVAAHFIRAAVARSPLSGMHGLLARVLRGLAASCGSDFHDPAVPWNTPGRFAKLPADLEPLAGRL